MARITISLPDNLYATFRERADFNRRSMSSEIAYTLEAALAMEMDININMLRALNASPEGPRTE